MPCLYKSTLGTVFDYLGIDLETKCGQLRQRRQLKQCGQLRQLVTKILRLIQHHSTAPRAPCAPYCNRLPSLRLHEVNQLVWWCLSGCVRVWCFCMVLLHPFEATVAAAMAWDTEISYEDFICHSISAIGGFAASQESGTFWSSEANSPVQNSTNIQNLCNRDFNVLCWFYDTKPLSRLYNLYDFFLNFLIFVIFCSPSGSFRNAVIIPKGLHAVRKIPCKLGAMCFVGLFTVSIQVVRTYPFYKQLVEVIASIPYPWRLVIICNDM